MKPSIRGENPFDPEVSTARLPAGRVHQLERDHAYDSPEYQAINAVLTTFFTLRTAPAPDAWRNKHAQHAEMGCSRNRPWGLN